MKPYEYFLSKNDFDELLEKYYSNDKERIKKHLSPTIFKRKERFAIKIEEIDGSLITKIIEEGSKLYSREVGLEKFKKISVNKNNEYGSELYTFEIWAVLRIIDLILS